ncbi:hypothetical protein [Thermaurantiacus sp.]
MRRRALLFKGHGPIVVAIAAGLGLAACGAGQEGAEKADSEPNGADQMSETELRETDLDMPDISIADAVPRDPAGKLAADDRSGAGALAVDPLAGDYPESPPPGGDTAGDGPAAQQPAP